MKTLREKVKWLKKCNVSFSLIVFFYPIYKLDSIFTTSESFSILKGFADDNPLPDNEILDWSQMKQIADDILRCI